MNIENVTIFSSPSELYLSNGDQALIKITGEDRLLLELLIEKLTDYPEKDEDDIFEILKDHFNHDREYFDLMINYLVEKNVLIPETSNMATPMIKNILVIGKFDSPEDVKKSFIELIDRGNIKYNLAAHLHPNSVGDAIPVLTTGIDMVILFSPILGNIELFQELSKATYLKNIPVLHMGLENTAVTIGPLVDPALNTASLYCYLRRKAAGLDNLEQYLTATQITNKKYIADINLVSNPYFRMLTEIAGVELHKYFTRKKRTSIIGREIELNCVAYSTNGVKILKTPYFLT